MVTTGVKNRRPRVKSLNGGRRRVHTSREFWGNISLKFYYYIQSARYPKEAQLDRTIWRRKELDIIVTSHVEGNRNKLVEIIHGTFFKLHVQSSIVGTWPAQMNYYYSNNTSRRNSSLRAGPVGFKTICRRQRSSRQYRGNVWSALRTIIFVGSSIIPILNQINPIPHTVTYFL